MDVDPATLDRAAAVLRAGGLVVLPTETVYGLAANALDPDAVRRIFAAKGRPADNPLIVHVADAAAAQALTSAWPPAATALAQAFWPGPLTLVLPRAPHVPDVTTGGLDTVAVRVPDHPVALVILRAARVPLAAPSANISGRPSPTRCQDAKDDLGDRVDVYVDAGATRVGVESTVVEVTSDRVTLLRPGGLAREALEAVVGPVDVASASKRSPGTRYRHYAPRARILIVAAADVARAADRAADQGAKVWVIASSANAAPGHHVSVPGAPDDAAGWAHRLFAILRDADANGVDTLVVEAIPEVGIGAAVMERLRKAAGVTRAGTP